MLKTTTRLAPRRIVSSKLPSISSNTRFLSTAPPKAKRRSWKSSAARWGIVIGGIYWYNTSPLFAEEPEASIARLDETIQHVQELNLPTVDAIVEEKRQRRLAAEREQQAAKEAYLASRNEEPAAAGEENVNVEELEEEAGQQAAFNPETGEINWDCPCLGGMAHGPCGEEFKAAFSCFVYSQEDPKGMDCIDKFKGMQDCFRAHPDEYGAELEDDEEEVEDELRAREELKLSESKESEEVDKEITKADESAPNPPKTQPAAEAIPHSNAASKSPAPAAELKTAETPLDATTPSTEKQAPALNSEGDSLIPKAAFDATDKN